MIEIFHSVFSVSILPTPSKPIQYESHFHNHELNHPYSAVEAPDITSTIATQTNKSLSHTIHLPTNYIPIILTTLQQLLVCYLNRYHTIVNHEDDIYNRA